jgi:hypothetical protein
MPGDLDDICAQIECPKCGRELSVPFRVIRLQKAVGCQCRAMIALQDDTPLAELQRLIDEQNSQAGANDD